MEGMRFSISRLGAVICEKQDSTHIIAIGGFAVYGGTGRIKGFVGVSGTF